MVSATGAKLTNIFSDEFVVETACSEQGLKFRQVFSKNMSEKLAPEIKSSKEDFTRITFRPDLAKFGMVSLDRDFLDLVQKRVYDLAGTAPKYVVH